MPGSAIHEDYRRREPAAVASERSFGLTVGVVVALIGMWPLIRGGSPRLYLVVCGVSLAMLGWLRPRWLAWPNRAWTALGRVLGIVVGHVTIALLYYLLITPLGLLLRLTGKDLLGLKRDPGAASYWIERRPPGPAPETMRNQF